MFSFRKLAKLMDPNFPPNCFKGSKISWLDENTETKWLQQNVKDVLSTLPNKPDIGLWHKQDKGLFQMYCWPSYRNPRNNNRVWSFRDIAKRHQHPEWTFKMLWYNTWLLNDALGGSDKPDYENRNKEIGQAIAKHGYHLVGLCEVMGEDLCEVIAKEVKKTHKVDWRRGEAGNLTNISSGLLTLAIDKVTFGSVKRMAFDNKGGGWDAWANKGVLYTELKLQLANSSVENPAIDFFITHTHADERDTRTKQFKELFEFVKLNRNVHNPLIIAGDMNVDSRDSSEYAALLREMASRDLYDVWLSRGSLSGASCTNIESEIVNIYPPNDDYELICPFNADDGSQYCLGYQLKDEADSRCVPGYRLDYVFIEEPKEHHTIMIDIPRVQRQPFWRGKADNRFFWANKEDEIPNFMSDHLGLELELIVNLKTDLFIDN